MTSKIKERRVNYGFNNENSANSGRSVVGRDDDFGLSDSESSEEEGEDVYTYSGKHNLARGAVVALSKAVSSEPLKIITTLVNFSAMSAVPSACYDSGSEDVDEEENLECFGE